MPRPELGTIEPLPESIAVVAGTDVDSLWEPFRFYEAGHHLMDIMNPLSSAGLDSLVNGLGVTGGEDVLDIACGHGELLGRLGAGPDSNRHGVELSPWTIRRAAQRLEGSGTTPARLIVGDGRAHLANDQRSWDVISLIGAPWIFGGFEGSVQTLRPRLRSGGRLAIADVFVTSPEVKDRLDETYGEPITTAEQRATLENAGFTDLAVMPVSAQDWRDYDDRVEHGIRAWLEQFPDDGHFLERQLEEETHRADDADVGWQVWIGTAA